jgi:hypothetical protein
MCGDDILASSARCCLTASLYRFNITRRLSEVAISLKKSFTCITQRLIELTHPPEATWLPVVGLCSRLRQICKVPVNTLHRLEIRKI